MSVTELSLSRYYSDVAFLRGLYVHPRLRNRNNRWRMKRERVRERRLARAANAELDRIVAHAMLLRRITSKVLPDIA